MFVFLKQLSCICPPTKWSTRQAPLLPAGNPGLTEATVKL